MNIGQIRKDLEQIFGRDNVIQIKDSYLRIKTSSGTSPVYGEDEINLIEIYSIVEQSSSRKVLNELFPNLYFYDGPFGPLWRKDNTGRDRESLPKAETINDLINLEENCKRVNNAESYFVCTCCGNDYSKEGFYGFVMAGKYCKDCAEKHPSIKRSYEESLRPGFYD